MCGLAQASGQFGAQGLSSWVGDAP